VAFLVVLGLVVVALLGMAFLHQSEGGKIFAPGGAVAPATPPPPPPPPKVTGLDASSDTGAFTHDLLLTNKSGGDLSEVELTITFYKPNGKKLPVKQFWGAWRDNEVKTINVAADQYQKVAINGTTLSGFESRKSVIDTSWTWTWGKK
jgi:hypothetical protein